MVKVQLELTEEQHKQLKVFAIKRGVTMKKQIVDILEGWIRINGELNVDKKMPQ